MNADKTLLLILLAACAPEAAPTSGDAARSRPVVLTTLYPVHYFAQRLAGSALDVRCVVPATADPLHWRPDRATLATMQDADLLVLSGAGAEPWLAQVSLPDSRVLEAAAPLAEHWLRFATTTHSHGAGATHTHAGIDPHLWMDPVLAGRMVVTIMVRLRGLVDDATIAERERALQADLSALDARCRALGPQPDGEVILASHPAWDYPARRYGWRLRNLDLDPATPLTEAALAALRTQLADTPARLVLWETPPTAAVAAQTAQLGLRDVVFAPCETLPDTGAPDYLAAMNASLDRLAEVWRP